MLLLFLFFEVVLSGEPNPNQGRRFVDRKLVQAPSNFITGRPKAALYFGSLVVLDVVCGYVLLFLLDIKIDV